MKASFVSLALLFSLVGPSFAECQITVSAAPVSMKVLQRYRFKGVDYASICKALEKGNAGVYFNGGTAVTPAGANAAWASVSIVDAETKLMKAGLASTVLRMDTNQDPDVMLHSVTMEALRDMDFEVAIRQLNEMRRSDIRWRK